MWQSFMLTPTIDAFTGEDSGISIKLRLKENARFLDYELEFESSFATRVRFELTLVGERNYFHLIPCNIYGDNNLSKVSPGHFPHLTKEFPEVMGCSPLWEFRADRSSHPVSILCCDKGAIGISIEPYTTCADGPDGFIRNGLFARLPNSFGVSLGYGNDPLTFINKDMWGESTKHLHKGGCVTGTIYAYSGNGRQDAHTIINDMYFKIHNQPTYHKSLSQAVHAMYTALLTVGWSTKYDEFADCECKVPIDRILKPWRPNVEIGWTGGAVTAYPMMVAEHVLQLSSKTQGHPGNPQRSFDRIINSYNEASGLFNDLTRPDQRNNGDSLVNGWWTHYNIKDCHCAYTNGSAAYYLFKALHFQKTYHNQISSEWLRVGLKVLDTVVALQRNDGCLGYTYNTKRPEVLDWEGMAGCWFAAAMPYAYFFTKDKRYLKSADKALDFYSQYVDRLTCFGTPMDTWKSIDEEGSLAFIRTAKELHVMTGDSTYVTRMDAGAKFEYLWRYAYKVRPEFEPLRSSGWNSCGGSLTSVSNPHIHPMSVFITSDLEYLAEQSGNYYHQSRADDSLAWGMNCLEQYPDAIGHGPYGVSTERWCPSDGLIIERFSDGRPSSTWFCYNIWAASAILEGVAERLLRFRERDKN